MQSIAQILAKELGQPAQYVENVIALLDEGSTIPFIARYRKELHGSMDDTTLRKPETGCSICGTWTSGGRRSRAPSRGRGS